MSGVSENYAQALDSLNLEETVLQELRELVASDELVQALGHPFVSRSDKHHVIEKLFPVEAQAFMKVMSDNGDVPCLREAMESFEELLRKKKSICKAVFTYVTKPNEEQIERLKKAICKQYGKSDVELQLVEDPSLVGGFVLQVDDFVLDKSLKAAVLRMQHHFAAR